MRRETILDKARRPTDISAAFIERAANRQEEQHMTDTRPSNPRSKMPHLKFVLPLLIWIWSVAPPAVAQTFPVIQKKAFWPDGGGELIITPEAMEFRAAGKEQNSRRWLYRDIQHLDRISPNELVILSYEDQKWQLGRDREFRFVLTEGQITNALFETLRSRLGKPSTDRVVGEEQNPLYEIAVKHLHTFGGCEGRLVFTRDAVTYQTDHAKDAREWRLDSEIESVWSQGPFRLDIHVHENNRREFSATRVYQFALKQRLDNGFYSSLKKRLYGLTLAGGDPPR
jgi:hypothetical protein